MAMRLGENLRIELTDDQREALAALEAFLLGNEQFFMLKGYAGTGKTFLLGLLTKYLSSQNRPFRLMAPTGRAAMILQQKTAFEAATIHKSIYSYEDIEDREEKDFKIYFKLRLNDDSEGTVYIIDEASMLSDIYNEEDFLQFGSGYLLTDLIRYISPAHRRHSKIIFCGDNGQLPPIGMNFSPALNTHYLQDKFGSSVLENSLKTVVRQKAKSAILLTANQLHAQMDAKRYNEIHLETGSGEIEKLEVHDFFREYIRRSQSRPNPEQIAIAYTNKQVWDMNRTFRETYFPGKTSIQPGDLLIINRNRYDEDIELFNGLFIEVLEIEEDLEKKQIAFKKRDKEKTYVEISFRTIQFRLIDHSYTEPIKCKIIDSLLHSDAPRLSEDEQRGLYVDFVNRMRKKGIKPKTLAFKEMVKTDPWFNALQVKFGYAITCHKAQGGEWHDVFVDFRAMKGRLTESYFRWAYTAMTRTQEKLFAMNFMEKSPVSDILYHSPKMLSQIPAHRFPKVTLPEKAVPNEISNPLLRQKYAEIQYKLGDDFSIDVQHFPYRERYTIGVSGISAVFDFIYGKKGFRSEPVLLSATDLVFASEIAKILQSPIRAKITAPERKSFHYPLYEMLTNVCSGVDLHIGNILYEAYKDIYFLEDGEEFCGGIEFYYNDKELFTSAIPFFCRDDSPKLKQIMEVLKNG
jgi:tRNA A37 threonylcarbamoyladenosine biosynthesis protein TsaE